MPGIIPHLIAGTCMFLVGEYYLHYKAKDQHPPRDHILLLGGTLFFSLFPDFPLGLYYIFNLAPREVLMQYHIVLHAIITPIALTIFVIVAFFVKSKRKSFWLVGILCILIHIVMDAFIHEGGIWL